MSNFSPVKLQTVLDQARIKPAVNQVSRGEPLQVVGVKERTPAGVVVED